MPGDGDSGGVGASDAELMSGASGVEPLGSAGASDAAPMSGALVRCWELPSSSWVDRSCEAQGSSQFALPRRWNSACISPIVDSALRVGYQAGCCDMPFAFSHARDWKHHSPSMVSWQPWGSAGSPAACGAWRLSVGGLAGVTESELAGELADGCL